MGSISGSTLGRMTMKRMLFAFVLLCSTITSNAQETEQEIVEAITAEFMAYIEDFIARDFDVISGHFQVPAMFGSTLVIGNTSEEIAQLFAVQPIQNDYKYSTVDSLDVNRLADGIYVLNLSFSRYNGADELVFQGKSIYLFSKDSGSWKIFFMKPTS